MLEEITAEEIEQYLMMAVLPQPPYLMAGIGLLMSVLCGLTFGRLVQNKLDGWKEDRLPLLPLATAEIVLSFSGTLIGVTLFIGCCLQIFGFAAGAALLVAFVMSLLTGGALFAQLERLMQQVEDGNFKAVDFDNFDEFF
ncbi:MAG: hypothetical protein WBH13_08420 [Parasynechococcus sp.]|nr:hypothetical protein [Synechococcus sp. BS307-5m-G36]MBL6880093.1 hypothetical protein [Synechococcus sp. BS30m-G31]MDB4638727.1 hypothetical protein [bacterium]